MKKFRYRYKTIFPIEGATYTSEVFTENPHSVNEVIDNGIMQHIVEDVEEIENHSLTNLDRKFFDDVVNTIMSNEYDAAYGCSESIAVTLFEKYDIKQR